MRAVDDSSDSIKAAFQLVLGTPQLFFRNRIRFELGNSETIDCTTLLRRFARSSGIDGKTPSIAIGIQIAVNRVCQSLPLPNVLKQARAHAAAQQGVENIGRMALFVGNGCEGTPTQICTCSSDFLLRRMMREAVSGRCAVKAIRSRLHLSEVPWPLDRRIPRA